MKCSCVACFSSKVFKPIKLGKKPEGTRLCNFPLLPILSDPSVNLEGSDEDELRLIVFEDSQLPSGVSWSLYCFLVYVFLLFFLFFVIDLPKTNQYACKEGWMAYILPAHFRHCHSFGRGTGVHLSCPIILALPITPRVAVHCGFSARPFIRWAICCRPVLQDKIWLQKWGSTQSFWTNI